MTDFQTVTRNLQAPAVVGDFASMNPYASQLSTQVYNSVGFRAGASGLVIGLFAWLDPSTWTFASNAGAGVPQGFVGRGGMSALITTYLSTSGMTIPAGFPTANIYDGGDFWVVNSGTTETSPGQKAYANNTTGVATFAATGAPTNGGSGTTSTIAASTNGATGTIVDNLFTAVSGLSGSLVPGTALTGTGVTVGTRIVSQVLPLIGGETLLGLGRYLVTPRNQTVTSTAITGTYGTLTIGGTVVAGIAVGQAVASTSTAAGTVVTALGTGTGGAGTYIVNLTQTVGSEAIRTQTNSETGWTCASFGQPGELVKIRKSA